MRQAAIFLLAFSLAPVSGTAEGKELTKLEQAKEAFFNERYAEAEELARSAREDDPDDPETYELRTAILVFQVRAEVKGLGKTREDEIDGKNCQACAKLAAEIDSDVEKGLEKCKAVLVREPDSVRARFFFARLTLNRLWFHLETGHRGRREWGEFKEAKRLLDSILAKADGRSDIRAITARAWLDYVVGSRAWYERIFLGGGSKKNAIESLRRAVKLPGGEYDRAEARISLMQFLAEEKREDEAREIASELTLRFPDSEGFRKQAGNGTK